MIAVPANAAPPPISRWARLGVNVPTTLRRGGWYPVISVGPDDVVLEVRHALTVMRRPLLKISDALPTRWTMVPREWGGPYVVCPNCAERIWLRQFVRQLRCVRCHQVYEVDTELHHPSR